MTLKVVEQHKQGSEFKVKYIINNDVKNIMVRRFIENKKIQGDDYKILNETCKKVYEYNHWIICDCKDSADKPIIRFNRSSNGSLYLYRLTNRAAHDINCPFRKIGTSSVSVRKENRRYRAFTEITGPLNLMSKKADGISAGGSTNQSSSKSSSRFHRPTHKLAKLLYEIIDKAGLNRFNSLSNPNIKNALQKGVSELEIVSKHKLSDFFYQSANGIKPLSYKLRGTPSWPKQFPKQGILFVKVRSFANNTLDVYSPAYPGDKKPKIEKVNIKNRIYQWSGRFSDRTAPYMALILVTDTSEKPNYFEPFNAFLMPAYGDKSYMPVDSYYERQVLCSLYGLGFELKKNDVYFEIIKPLKDITVTDENGEEQYVLPDFIIELDHKTLVIEVNGSHEEEYLERKTRTHKLMEEIGEVLTIDAYGDEKNNALKKSIYMLMQKIKSEALC